MQAERRNELINNYIMNNYDVNTPIFVRDFYDKFPMISPGTIRSTIKRLYDRGKIAKIDDGVYALPNEDSIMNEATVYGSDIIRKKYLIDNENIVGYISGLNFSNLLGLTTQTASVDTIFSNKVSSQKRKIIVSGYRVVVGKPRVKVNNVNYRLLQILELLSNFKKYSEYDLKEAAPKILKYLKDVKLTENELEQIVSKYSFETQSYFYKIGGLYVVTSASRGI